MGKYAKCGKLLGEEMEQFFIKAEDRLASIARKFVGVF
jgi:hypothetical protein